MAVQTKVLGAWLHVRLVHQLIGVHRKVGTQALTLGLAVGSPVGTPTFGDYGKVVDKA